MAERAQREPTMEEIVVALRETRRGADRMSPLTLVGQSRGNRALRGSAGPTDLIDLRDGEIERLLSENARLNARVVSLLKVIEHEQAYHAEAAAEVEAAPMEADRSAIYREVRSALEAELSPVLLVLLRLLERQRTDPGAGDSRIGERMALSAATGAAPSDWIIDLMHKLDTKAPAPNDTAATAEAMPRRPKLRDRMADVLNAFRLEPDVGTSRRRFTSSEGPL
jgi:hypothetical protein